MQTRAVDIGHDMSWPVQMAVDHYITRLDFSPRTITLKRAITVPGTVPGPKVQVLAYAGHQPLLLAANFGRGRVLLWTSYEWTEPQVKGKLSGMDDLVWRGLVWAARKPFVLRGMPHYLALRVDDVSGWGLGTNRHLGWITTANRYGLKPWVGVFIDDLREDPEAIRALATFTQRGRATASVHARRQDSFFYLEEPLWRDANDGNVAAHDWPDDKIAANFREADEFCVQHGIPKSPFVVPHYYELGANVFEGLRQWGAKYLCTVLEPGRGLGAPVLQSGPYLSHEPRHSSSAPDPIYIADWYRVPGHPEYDRQFFNFVEEVRDVAGYEWAPSHVRVEEAIRRGVDECRRGFDSLLPAVLFTHESDHIQHLQPQEWDQILKGVMEELKPYQPIPVTLDYLAQYLRALNTSRVLSAKYDEATKEGTVELEGDADVPTKFYVFPSSGETSFGNEWEAPPFQKRVFVKWR